MVNTLTDAQLLGEYAAKGSETAFAELVRRHVDLVYSVAQRLMQNPAQVQDVTQGVFLVLARNADHLQYHPALVGWLHRTTQNIAAQTVRTEARRQRREQEAVTMSDLLSPDTEPAWEVIAPQLDAALSELSEIDREVTLLRYFEKKTAAEIAGLLGTSEAAVQKRAQRALEGLRHSFARQGIAAGVTGLATVLTANAVHAAPTGLVTIFTAAALANSATATVTASTITAKTIAMTTLQKLAVAATVTLLAGAVFFEAKQVKQVRAENQSLQVAQAALQSKIDQAPPPVSAPPAAAPVMVAAAPSAELLKLRGEVAVLRQQADSATEKARVAEQKLVAEMDAVDKFNGYQAETINASKMVGLAVRIWSGDNGGQYPQNVMDLTNELSLKRDESGHLSTKLGNIDLTSLTYLKPADNQVAENHPDYVLAKERISRQAPDGTWRRIYLFADGSVQTASSFNGDFSGWEKANTYIPPADPTN